MTPPIGDLSPQDDNDYPRIEWKVAENIKCTDLDGITFIDKGGFRLGVSRELPDLLITLAVLDFIVKSASNLIEAEQMRDIVKDLVIGVQRDG